MASRLGCCREQLFIKYLLRVGFWASNEENGPKWDPSQRNQCQDDRGKRKDSMHLRGTWTKNWLDVVLQADNKKLLQVSKSGNVIDNDQEIDWIFISFWNVLQSSHLKKEDENNEMRIFCLWMLLRMWMQEKLTDTLIFGCPTPIPIRLSVNYLMIINICPMLLQFAKPLPKLCFLLSPQQPWEFAKQFHWDYHTGLLNSHGSFPSGPPASQACHLTVLQTQQAFTLPWLCICGSLCQERSPSLPCFNLEVPYSFWETLGRQGKVFFPGARRKGPHPGVGSPQPWCPCQRWAGGHGYKFCPVAGLGVIGSNGHKALSLLKECSS